MENKEGYEKMDLTHYPEGPREIIKYLDFLLEDPEERMDFLLGGYMNCVVVM